MPLSPIKPSEHALAGRQQTPPGAPRTLRLPFDPVMLLAVIGLGVCSVVTLGASTRNLIAGDPRYYVDRQTIYQIGRASCRERV